MAGYSTSHHEHRERLLALEMIMHLKCREIRTNWGRKLKVEKTKYTEIDEDPYPDARKRRAKRLVKEDQRAADLWPERSKKKEDQSKKD